MEPESNKHIFEEDDDSSEIDSSYFDIELPSTNNIRRMDEEKKEIDEEELKRIEEVKKWKEKHEEERINNELAVVYDFIIWTFQSTYGIFRIMDEIKEIENTRETLNGCFLCRIEVNNMQYFRLNDPRVGDREIIEMLRGIQDAKQRKLYLNVEEKRREMSNIQRYGYDRVTFIELYYRINNEILVLIVRLRTNKGEEIANIPFGLMKNMKVDEGYIKGYNLMSSRDVRSGKYDEGILINCIDKQITMRLDEYYIMYDMKNIFLNDEMIKQINLSAYFETALKPDRVLDLEADVETNNMQEVIIEEEKVIPNEICMIYDEIIQGIWNGRLREKKRDNGENFSEKKYEFEAYQISKDQPKKKIRVIIHLKRNNLIILYKEGESIQQMNFRYSDFYIKDGMSYGKGANKFTMYKELRMYKDESTYEEVYMIIQGVKYILVSVRPIE